MDPSIGNSQQSLLCVYGALTHWIHVLMLLLMPIPTIDIIPPKFRD